MDYKVNLCRLDSKQQKGLKGTSLLTASAVVMETAGRKPSLLGEEGFALLHVWDDGVAPGFPAGGANCGEEQRLLQAAGSFLSGATAEGKVQA